MADNAVTQIQERMRSVYQIVTKDLANCQSNAKTIDALNDVQRQIECPDPNNPTTEPQNRLNILVKGALQEAEAEEKIIKDALFKIYEVRAIINERRIKIKKTNTETFRRGALMKSLQTSALTLPLWIGKPGEKPPALCGAVPPDSNYVANVGDLVAALQKVEGGENWILAEVVEYNATTKLYNLEDIDEEQKEKGRFSLNKRRVIPLPLYRANPGTDPEFLYPTNCVVMALYPQTTCFYKGIVKCPPATHAAEYEVLFDDATYEEGYSPPFKIAQRYVIPYRDKKAKLSGHDSNYVVRLKTT